MLPLLILQINPPLLLLSMTQHRSNSKHYTAGGFHPNRLPSLSLDQKLKRFPCYGFRSRLLKNVNINGAMGLDLRFLIDQPPPMGYNPKPQFNVTINHTNGEVEEVKGSLFADNCAKHCAVRGYKGEWTSRPWDICTECQGIAKCRDFRNRARAGKKALKDKQVSKSNYGKRTVEMWAQAAKETRASSRARDLRALRIRTDADRAKERRAKAIQRRKDKVLNELERGQVRQ